MEGTGRKREDATTRKKRYGESPKTGEDERESEDRYALRSG